jgi:hypothetical protein
LACGDTIAFGDVDHYTVTCDPPAPPRPYPVKEGDKSIGGVAGDAANVTADVTVGEILIERATGAAKDGQFSVTFQNKLVTSQTIVLTGKTADSVPVPGQNITVQPIDFDWGRVRAYFVAGVLFSQNDGGSSNGNFFSRQDFFMSFNLDKNWAYRRNWRFHSFFDARLGAIPVHNDSPKPSSSTTGSGSTTGSSSTTGSGSTTGSATTTATPFSDPNSFAGSQKVGTFVAGIYAPFTATRWYYHDQPNSFFIAPLMKIGFSTPSNEALRDNASAIVVPSTNRFFTQMVGGLRFGQVREYELHCPCRPGTERDLSKAPELISYLDAGLGKFGNFLESPGPALPTDSRVYRLWRYQLEGILKIPSTPLFIGFQANVAAQHGHKDYRQPPDDLRILFGTRFDIGKLFAKLLTF